MIPFVVCSLILLVAGTSDAARYEEKEVLLYLKEDDDLCVGLKRGVKKSSRLDVVECDDSNAEQCWDLKYRENDDKYFRMHPCNDNELCVQTSRSNEKGKLKLRPCKDDGRQYFWYDKQGKDKSISPKNNIKLCLEPKKVKKDRPIWLRKCSHEDNQAWETWDFDGGGGSSCEEKCISVSDEKFEWCEDAPKEKRDYWLEEYGAMFCGEYQNKWKDACVMRECDGLSCKNNDDCKTSERPFCAKSLGICVQCLKSSDCDNLPASDWYCAEPGEVDEVEKYYTCQD